VENTFSSELNKMHYAIQSWIRVRKIPNRPKSFFKYMTARVAKIVLVNQKLRWSSPLLFNDPFDVQRDFDLGFDIEEIKKPLVNELLALVSAKKVPDLSRKPRVEYFVNRLRREDYGDIRNIIIRELPGLIDEGIQSAKNGYQQLKNKWSQFIPHLRIFCLSEIPDSPLMWSHYSDSHKGVVVELEGLDSLDSAWLAAQPVTYQSSPPMLATIPEWVKSITGQQSIDLLSLLPKYACTKTPEWEYEKEWRVVFSRRRGDTGLYTDYAFNPQELRSVYLGCGVSDDDDNDIVSLLSYDFAHVKVYRGKKIQRDRKLSFTRIER